MKRICLFAVVLAGAIIVIDGCKARKVRFVTIGTGGVTGLYYPTGGAISKMVNDRFGQYGIKATVESTSGSVFNINAVLNGDLEFGVVQSDRQFQAYNGLAEWSEAGRQTELRSVFSIHPEEQEDKSGKSRLGTITELKGRLKGSRTY
jgi:TRAP transporter TAXI family solute receptor